MPVSKTFSETSGDFLDEIIASRGPKFPAFLENYIKNGVKALEEAARSARKTKAPKKKPTKRKKKK